MEGKGRLRRGCGGDGEMVREKGEEKGEDGIETGGGTEERGSEEECSSRHVKRVAGVK